MLRGVCCVIQCTLPRTQELYFTLGRSHGLPPLSDLRLRAALTKEVMRFCSLRGMAGSLVHCRSTCCCISSISRRLARLESSSKGTFMAQSASETQLSSGLGASEAPVGWLLAKEIDQSARPFVALSRTPKGRKRSLDTGSMAFTVSQARGAPSRYRMSSRLTRKGHETARVEADSPVKMTKKTNKTPHNV